MIVPRRLWPLLLILVLMAAALANGLLRQLTGASLAALSRLPVARRRWGARHG